jgi:tRNA/tmRNA/rRNA uracil-C5-methylase (TrmA/RlmC/RlmD family)
VTLVLGDRIELTVGPPAHGGHCVARESGLVVFVRHALPGERVVAEVTEVHRGYLRADAVEVLEASPDRVAAPCPYAHPDGCGGCDLQHATAAAQREWKAAVVREQLARLAGVSSDLEVRALPGGLLDWRSRVRYTVDAAGRAGLLKHRSHEVVPIERCLIAHPSIQALPVLSEKWPEDSVSTVASSAGEVVVGPGAVHERAVGREWTLPADVFWQVHPAAADTLASAVLELLEPRPDETAWDLYGGAGLFAAALASAGARVTLVESSAAATAAARSNLDGPPQVEVVSARVEQALRRLTGPVDLVVLDPPRSGAGASVVRAVVAARPRAVAYVACDPAAFARDVGTFREAGWQLAEVRAYDCFPMTHHIECVGLLAPTMPV